MDRPQIPVPGFQEPDAYDYIVLRWLLVPEAVRVHLLLHLISSLSLAQKQELRECCEGDMEGWCTAWE